MLVFNPITIFWLLLACSFIFHKRKLQKASRLLLTLGVAELFVFSVTPLPAYMIQQLEEQYPVYKASGSERLPILVLGNYHADDASLHPSQRLSVQALERVTEGLRIYRALPGTSIAFSGYAVNEKSPTATIMAETAVSLGVAAKDTIVLPTPKNTWEEAVAYKKRFGANTKFILVTNGTHMPRAVETFKRLDMQPIPAPTGFFIKKGTRVSPYNWWPSSIKLLYTEIAFYEYSAQLYYKWFK